MRGFDTPLPDGIGRFDVVLSLTLDYQLSAGDHAELHVFYCPNADPPVPCPLTFLAPGLLSLASSSDVTTTTLQWYGKGLATDGYVGWHYEVSVEFVDGNGDGRVTMSGSKMLAVFEMTPGR